MKKVKFCDVLEYEQPSKYIVESDQYKDEYKTPVLTAGKSFILGYTNETQGIYHATKENPIILFDDFTTDCRYIDFDFKVKSSAVKILKLKRNDNNLKYLYYILKNIVYDTSSHKRYWISQYSKFDIKLPNIEIQNEIVKEMEKIEDLMKNKETQLQKFEEIAKAQFYEIFGDVGKNTKEYPVAKLPDIAEYWNGLTYKPKDVSESGILVLRSSNIQNGQLSFEDNVRVDCQIPDKKLVKNNDILMCARNGSARLVGKVALIKDINENMAFGAFMMIIRSKYYPYLLYYFQTNAFRAQILTGETATINQITGYMLDNIKIPVPLDEEIERFVSIVELIDAQKEICTKIIDKLNELKKSKTQEYFGGVIDE